jgi:membrane protein implicated in regulation of membrane protease activity
MEDAMNDVLTPTAFWLALGFLLMALELASGAAVLIFCGLGALAMGVLLAVGLAIPAPWQVVLAAALALVAALAFRPLLRRSLRGHGTYVDHVGALVVAETPVEHDTPGIVRHRGTVWQARAVRGEALASGDKGVVTGMEGIELRVRRA